MIKQVFAVLCAGSVLSGCVATPPLREIAVDTNRLVADTANDQTMLNILRAKDRMPMHFTSFTELRGNLSVEGTASLGLELPDDGVEQAIDALGAVTGTTRTRGVSTVSPSIGATVSANPGFDLAVYDTKEFQRGILTPVSESLIEYYLQQDWDEDLLTALFVARVDITATSAGSPPTTISFLNHPDNAEVRPDNPDFKIFLDKTFMVSRTEPGSISPLILLSRFGEGLTLADIATLDGSKYDIVVDPVGFDKGVYVARKRGDSLGINWNGLDEAILAHPNFATLGLARDDLKCSEPPRMALLEDFSGPRTATCSSKSKVPGAPTLVVTVQLRAPEGILYFLGEYVRCSLEKDAGGTCNPYELAGASRVIRIVRGSSPNSLFSVRHRDVTYSMPEPDYHRPGHPGQPDHRGSQAMVLVQQLINLQKSADDLPSSSSIQLVP